MTTRNGSFFCISLCNLPILLGGLACLLLVLPIKLSVAAQSGGDDQEGSAVAATTTAFYSDRGFPSVYTSEPPTNTPTDVTVGNTPTERANDLIADTPSTTASILETTPSPSIEVETTARDVSDSPTDFIPVFDCRIPAYSLSRNGSVNVIAHNSSFVVEGKCFATCLEEGRYNPDIQVEALIQLTKTNPCTITYLLL